MEWSQFFINSSRNEKYILWHHQVITYRLKNLLLGALFFSGKNYFCRKQILRLASTFINIYIFYLYYIIATSAPLTQTTVCSDDQSQNITCASGVIKITSVIFGRQDTQVCCYGNSVNFYGSGVCSSTSCSLDMTSSYSAMCDQQTMCTLNVPTIIDPCPAVYKYVKAVWDCEAPGK